MSHQTEILFPVMVTDVDFWGCNAEERKNLDTRNKFVFRNKMLLEITIYRKAIKERYTKEGFYPMQIF